MTHTLSKKIRLWILGSILAVSPLGVASAATPLELVQMNASRAVGSFAMYRGEGKQKPHAARLESDLAALNSAFQGTQEPSEALQASYKELLKQIRLGMTYGPEEDDVPWGYVADLSQALRVLLLEANEMADSSPESLVPVQIEYLAMQYLYRSYLGSFETARDRTDIYVGQDERTMLPEIDKVLAGMDGGADVIKLKTRWSYLRAALEDMNSGSNALESASGRAFAPITVARHSRNLTESWVSLQDSVTR
jgi:hypothetical protein